MAYDRVLIRDLGSRNGVRVNGRVVEEARLHFGDELAIGPVLFRLELEPAEVRPSAAARPAGASSASPPYHQPSALGNPPPQRDPDFDLVPLDDI
jgi:hypothetical protein